MKKILPLIFVLASFISRAQIICIFCYDQNDSISSNVTNLIQNGSFEQGCANFGYFIPNSNNYNCNLTGWTASGGGPMTYACTYDSSLGICVTPNGRNIAYFGNGVFARVCSAAIFDTSCIGDSACMTTNIQPGYPYNDSTYGSANGPTIEQTVNGLIVGNTYILEFWAGGEGQSSGWMQRGIFAVDVGFGYTFLRCKPTNPGYVGTRYIIEFNATSTSHTIKFTSWGHVCGTCTELMMDDVRLYPLADLSPNVPPCAGATLNAMFTAPNHICPGTCTDFTNLSTNATSYIWSFPGANPSTSTDAQPTNICYNTPGNYNVQLIASNATTSDTLTLPNYITVYPFPSPQGINQSGDTLFANAGAPHYQWFFNGVIIPGATNYFYVAPSSGNYSVVVTDNNSCEVEAVILNVIASVQSAVSSGQLTIYPNPVTEELIIKNEKLIVGTATVSISIFNVIGEEVYTNVNYTTEKIDCRKLQPGMYILELRTEERTFRTKFTKQ